MSKLYGLSAIWRFDCKFDPVIYKYTELIMNIDRALWVLYTTAALVYGIKGHIPSDTTLDDLSKSLIYLAVAIWHLYCSTFRN